MIRTLSSALLIAVSVVAAAAMESGPPNVVFIMVDDLGWSDVGFNGSQVYETPNIDRLASQGMVLSDFYSGGPVCSSSSAEICGWRRIAPSSEATTARLAVSE